MQVSRHTAQTSTSLCHGGGMFSDKSQLRSSWPGMVTVQKTLAPGVGQPILCPPSKSCIWGHR